MNKCLCIGLLLCLVCSSVTAQTDAQFYRLRGKIKQVTGYVARVDEQGKAKEELKLRSMRRFARDGKMLEFKKYRMGSLSLRYIFSFKVGGKLHRVERFRARDGEISKAIVGWDIDHREQIRAYKTQNKRIVRTVLLLQDEQGKRIRKRLYRSSGSARYTETIYDYYDDDYLKKSIRTSYRNFSGRTKRQSYFYDDAGRFSKMVASIKNAQGEWSPNLSFIFSDYDPLGNPLQGEVYRHDSPSQDKKVSNLIFAYVYY